MNLYGEYANVSVLKRHISEQKIECEVTRTDSCRDINFDEFDFIYIGSGTEKAQKQALADLYTKRDKFINSAKNGKLILLTGNALEIAGDKITDNSGKVYEGLGLCRFKTTENYEQRLTGDVVCSCRFLPDPLVGFINKCSCITGIDEPLFSIKMGYGNSNGEDKNEGFRYKNVFGTHLIGPILVKNPHFTEYVIKLIFKDTDDFNFKDTFSAHEHYAYEITLRELNLRIANTSK